MTTNLAVPQTSKKLIEVDLPLRVINVNTAAEPVGSKGHPWTLQQWWARRRLTACRVVIFASMVDDPSSYLKDPEEVASERKRLHDIVERLSLWRNSGDESLLAEARYEIARSVARQRDETAPTEPGDVLEYLGDPEKRLNIYDPFTGGGCIPLEAQRLGLRTTGTDLNPVAVLITKALIELPHKFTNRPPINPEADPLGITMGNGRRARRITWRGGAGLANDIRYYGQSMRQKGHDRIGHLYPSVTLGDASQATVLAWIWARTLPCPSPACGAKSPMVGTFQLSSKQGNRHWIKPEVDLESRAISFKIQNHKRGINDRDTASGSGATCLSCKTPISSDYMHEQVTAGNMGQQMIAIVAAGNRQRVYVSPNSEDIQSATDVTPNWRPAQTMPQTPTLVSGRGYGITHWHQLFSERQLAALTTFVDALSEVKDEMIRDGADEEYAKIVHTYLALAIGKAAVTWSSFGIWHKRYEKIEKAFGRQVIPMVWDYPEANPFSDRMQSWKAHVEHIASVVEKLPANVNIGVAHQADAATTIHATGGPVIVTDPPYYSNIDYADLSDFIYVWLRHSLRDSYPELFSGILTPKDEEMTAIPSRFDNHTRRFESLLRQTLELIKRHCSSDYPSSIFYAYKQQEEERSGIASTGWETMLSALVSAGFQIVGTWPLRTEQTAALKSNANVLASSVILVCRPRAEDAPVATRGDFIDTLAAEIQPALEHLTREGHIAPVDLRQAAIGPGMAIYSRFRRVETLSGEQVTVRQALVAINQAVAEYLEQQAGHLEPESQFCIDWLQEHPRGEGDFGTAENMARAYDLSIGDRLQRRHRLLTANLGKVTLLDIDDYDNERNYPRAGEEMTAWEGCMRMAWQMQPGENGDGIRGCVQVAQRVAGKLDDIERLARILYDIYDRRNDSRHAVAFNSVVTAWTEISQNATSDGQAELAI